MTLYEAFGIVLASDVPLPELSPAPSASLPAEASIRIGPLPELADQQEPVGARRIGPLVWASADRFWLRVPGIARFRIAGGREIIIDRDLGGDPAAFRPFLLGTALGVMLMQRGALVLHGSAVRVGEGCVVFVGPSGAGKSTLAAGFLRRGFGVLADDLVTVDDEGRVLPGVPRIKLWAHATRAMAIDTTGLQRIRPNLDKFSYPTLDGLDRIPVPVRAIATLGTTNRNLVSLTCLEKFAKFKAVSANVYRPQFIEAMALRRRYMEQCTRLAAAVPVMRLVRPQDGFTVDLLVDQVLQTLDRAM